MATNNAINLNASGIVSYDGAGTFSAVATPITVPHGGSGDTTLAAYAVLCGGTTSTGNLQSIASVGSSGQVLTSNGNAALPTFQAFSATGTGIGNLFKVETGIGNPADATTYLLSSVNAFTAFTANGAASTRYYAPIAGTITAVYGTITSTTGTNENCTLSLRKNNTTDTTVSSTIQLNASPANFNATGLSISMARGDYIEFKFVCPTWVTNPTGVALSATVLMT